MEMISVPTNVRARQGIRLQDKFKKIYLVYLFATRGTSISKRVLMEVLSAPNNVRGRQGTRLQNKFKQIFSSSARHQGHLNKQVWPSGSA